MLDLRDCVITLMEPVQQGNLIDISGIARMRGMIVLAAHSPLAGGAFDDCYP